MISAPALLGLLPHDATDEHREEQRDREIASF